MKSSKILLSFFILPLLWISHCTASAASPTRIRITSDQSYVLYINGIEVGSDSDAGTVESISVDLSPGDAIGVEMAGIASDRGLACEIEYEGKIFSSNFIWQYATTPSSKWQICGYDHSSWPNAQEYGGLKQEFLTSLNEFNAKTKWIGAPGTETYDHVYFWTRFNPSVNGIIKAAARDPFSLYLNGQFIGSGSEQSTVKFFPLCIKTGDLVAIEAQSTTESRGCMAQVQWIEGNEVRHSVVTDSSWKMSSTNQPDWEKTSFDDSSWKKAKSLGNRADSRSTSEGTLSSIAKGAKWIWNKKKNGAQKIWFRKILSNSDIVITSDDRFVLYHNGKRLGASKRWNIPQIYSLDLQKGDVIAVKMTNLGGPAGLMSSISFQDTEILTNGTWKYTDHPASKTWKLKNFDDSHWSNAVSYGSNGINPWGNLFDIDPRAEWIGSSNSLNQKVYFRFIVGEDNDSSTLTVLRFSAGPKVTLYVNGILKELETKSQSEETHIITLKLSPGDVLAFEADHWRPKEPAGFLLQAKGAFNFVSDGDWKISTVEETQWTSPAFDDGPWLNATSYGSYGAPPWGNSVKGWNEFSAEWIWSNDNGLISKNIDRKVFFRKKVSGLSARVINVHDGTLNISRSLEFHADSKTDPVVESPQAIQVHFNGTHTKNQVISIHTENSDGIEGMIGVTDPSFHVPLKWITLDNAIPEGKTCHELFEKNPSLISSIPDMTHFSLSEEGIAACQLNGGNACLTGIPCANGTETSRETHDGEVWIYFCADFKKVPAQTYRTKNLVIDIIETL